MRQRVLYVLDLVPKNAPNWIKQLDLECDNRDILFLSCMVHQLVAHRCTQAVLETLTRYQTIIQGLGDYVTNPNADAPSIRAFTGKTSSSIADYKDSSDAFMLDQVRKFRLNIEEAQQSFDVGCDGDMQRKRQLVMDIIRIRESLYHIFLRIQNRAEENFLQEDIRDILSEAKDEYLGSVQDIPNLIEEIEEGEPVGSVVSFLAFLADLSKRIEDFFSNNDYYVFEQPNGSVSD